MCLKSSALLLCTILILPGCGGSGVECPQANCAGYATQEEAQAAYNADHECLGELDNDSDGIACEHLPGAGGGTGGSGGGSGCPTTANCGCSNKTKAECGGDCCKWVVGEGCKCK